MCRSFISFDSLFRKLSDILANKKAPEICVNKLVYLFRSINRINSIRHFFTYKSIKSNTKYVTTIPNYKSKLTRNIRKILLLCLFKRSYKICVLSALLLACPQNVQLNHVYVQSTSIFHNYNAYFSYKLAQPFRI